MFKRCRFYLDHPASAFADTTNMDLVPRFGEDDGRGWCKCKSVNKYALFSSLYPGTGEVSAGLPRLWLEVLERWQITRLWQEVQRMGFEWQAYAARHWLRQRFGSPRDAGTQVPSRRSAPVSLQRVAWLMLRADPTRHHYLKKLYRQCPEIASLDHVACKLFEMIRTHNAAWPRWLEQAESSPLASSAKRLQRDQKAVLAALELP